MKSKNFFLKVLLLVLLIGCTKEGPEGRKSLIDLAIENKSQNCPAGGYKIMSGTDLNDNNILDENEIQLIKYICNGVDGINGINGTNGSDGVNGYNGLIKVTQELSGTNCHDGGFKICTGMDLNSNANLDDNEIQTTQFVCNGSDGGYDKQFLIYFPANGYAYGTSSAAGTVESIECIQNFSISNYLNIDSISFGAFLMTQNSNSSATIELYNVTDNNVIENTLISSTSTSWEWKSTSINFLNSLPQNPIKLGIRCKPQTQGVYASYYLPMIILYRK